MNRAMRRATAAFHRPAGRLPWQPFEPVDEGASPEAWARMRVRVGDLAYVVKNNIFIVQVYRRQTARGVALQLAVRRNDEEEIRGWDDLQRVKNEIAGPERTAIEIFPPEAEVMDQANMRHLFVLPEGVAAPFTIHGRWE